MLRSPLANPMTTPMINPIRTGISEITRAVLNFNGTQYSTLSEPVVLDGDFEIEIYFCIDFTAHAGWSTIFSGPNIRISGGGTNDTTPGLLRVEGVEFGGTVAGDNAVFTPAFVFSSDKIERVSIVRTGANWTFSNGRTEATLVRNSGSVELTALVRNVSSNGGTDSASGSIFSARAWKNGNRNTGELVTDLRFDEPDTIYQRNYAVPLGSELVANGDFSQGLSDWSPLNASLSSEPGVLRVTSTVSGVSARAAVTALTGLVPGQVYRVTANLVGSGGTRHINTTCVLNMRSGINGSGIFTSSPVYPFDGYGQRMELIFTADAESMNLWVRFDNGTADTSTYVEFGEISAQSWSGAILQNVLPGDWEEISKKSGDDFWLGTNLITPDVFQNPSFSGGDWNFIEGGWVCSDADGTGDSLTFITSSDQPEIMQVSGVIGSISGVMTFNQSNTALNTVDSVGAFQTEVDKSVAVAHTLKRASGPLNVRLNSIAIHRKLQYAEGAL